VGWPPDWQAIAHTSATVAITEANRPDGPLSQALIARLSGMYYPDCGWPE
jgi:hypothetical protein